MRDSVLCFLSPSREREEEAGGTTSAERKDRGRAPRADSARGGRALERPKAPPGGRPDPPVSAARDPGGGASRDAAPPARPSPKTAPACVRRPKSGALRPT